MSRGYAAFLLVGACLLASRAAGADPTIHAHHDGPERKGFTIKLSMGAGASTLLPSQGAGATYGGLGGLNLGIGGFINPSFAALFKVSGVNYGPFTDDVGSGLTAAAGPAVQWWPHDRFHVELGIGLGLLVASRPTEAAIIGEGTTIVVESEDARAGFGAMLGVGASLISMKNHALGLYADFAPVFTGDGHALAFHGGVMWQYH